MGLDLIERPEAQCPVGLQSKDCKDEHKHSPRTPLRLPEASGASTQVPSAGKMADAGTPVPPTSPAPTVGITHQSQHLSLQTHRQPLTVDPAPSRGNLSDNPELHGAPLYSRRREGRDVWQVAQQVTEEQPRLLTAPTSAQRANTLPPSG